MKIYALIMIVLFVGVGCTQKEGFLSSIQLQPSTLTVDKTTYDFGTHSIHTKFAYATLTLTSHGIYAAYRLGEKIKVPNGFSFKGGTYPGAGGTCKDELSDGASCTLVVSFSPDKAVGYDSEINVSFFNGVADDSVSLNVKGRGVNNATLWISEDGVNPVDHPINFPTIALGKKSIRTLYVLYEGAYAATGISPDFGRLANPAFSIESNSCPNEISKDCQLEVAFQSNVDGDFSSPFNLNYNNGAFSAVAAADLIGKIVPGAVPAQLTITPVTTSDFGTVALSKKAVLQFQVSNSGTIPADINQVTIEAPFSLAGGLFPGDGGTCTKLISGTCTLSLEFSPTVAGAASGSIVIQYRDGSDLQLAQLNLTGTAAAAALLSIRSVPDESVVAFGKTPVNYPVQKTLYVENLSPNALDATNITYSLSAPFKIVGGLCNSILKSGKSCTLIVEYKPTQSSIDAVSLSINYLDGVGNSTSTKMLSGEGTPGALLVMAPSFYDFGNVLVSKAKEVNILIRYYGVNPASVTGINNMNAVFSLIPNAGNCNLSMINANCVITVRFAPNSPVLFSSNVAFDYSNGAGGNGTTALSLRGLGRENAVLSIAGETASPVDYKTQSIGYSTEKTFTLKNIIPNAIEASSISISTSNSVFTLGTKNCASSLTANSSCTFNIRYIPTAAVTTDAMINVTYYDGSAMQSQSFAIRGTGTADALLVLNPIAFNFGAVPKEGFATGTIQVKHYGTKAASIVSTTGLAAPFTHSGGTCNLSTISTDCTLQFQFSPTVVGASSTVVSYVYDNGSGVNATISLTLSGTGVRPALLAFTVGNSYDFGRVAVNSTATVSLTISNSGDVSATHIEKNIGPGNFSIQGGTCGDTLKASSSCTVNIGFRPTANGINGPVTITMNYVDGVSAHGTQTVSLSLSGTGYSVASLVVTSSLEFNKAAYPMSGDLAVQITNNGKAVASFTSAPSISGSPDLTIKANSCVGNLGIDNSCQVTFHFQPSLPGRHTIALTLPYFDGNSNAQLSATIVAISTVPVQVSAGGNHTCVITELGQLQCFGENNYGQLGYGDTTNRLNPGGAVDLGNGVYPASVETGMYHTCTILNTGAVKCWGSNDSYQLGFASPDEERRPPIQPIDFGGVKATALSLGYNHTCALLVDKSVRCWGNNQNGQLGQADTTNRYLPTTINFGASVLGISTSAGTTCAVRSDGKLICVGDNYYGQLGTASQDSQGANSSSGFTAAVLSSQITQVSSGGGFACALTNSGVIQCWGRNANGVLGRLRGQDGAGNAGFGASYPNTLPGDGVNAQQMATVGFVDLGAGKTVINLKTGNTHVCALLSDHSLKCWGLNSDGQLALGDSANRGESPSQMGDALSAVNLGNAKSATQVSLGVSHTCAVLNDQSVKCWGRNTMGQLGYNDTNNRGDTPSSVGDSLPAVGF